MIGPDSTRALQDLHPLHHACWTNDAPKVATLLLQGHDPDALDDKMSPCILYTAWDYACHAGNEDAFKVLLAFARPSRYMLLQWKHPLLALNGYGLADWTIERGYYEACRAACVIIMALFKRRNRLIARVGCKYMARELALAVYATRATFLDAHYKNKAQ